MEGKGGVISPGVVCTLINICAVRHFTACWLFSYLALKCAFGWFTISISLFILRYLNISFFCYLKLPPHYIYLINLVTSYFADSWLSVYRLLIMTHYQWDFLVGGTLRERMLHQSQSNTFWICLSIWPAIWQKITDTGNGPGPIIAPPPKYDIITFWKALTSKTRLGTSRKSCQKRSAHRPKSASKNVQFRLPDVCGKNVKSKIKMYFWCFIFCEALQHFTHWCNQLSELGILVQFCISTIQYCTVH